MLRVYSVLYMERLWNHSLSSAFKQADHSESASVLSEVLLVPAITTATTATSAVPTAVNSTIPATVKATIPTAAISAVPTTVTDVPAAVPNVPAADTNVPAADTNVPTAHTNVPTAVTVAVPEAVTAPTTNKDYGAISRAIINTDQEEQQVQKGLYYSNISKQVLQNCILII